jgi:hypothetical protein
MNEVYGYELWSVTRNTQRISGRASTVVYKDMKGKQQPAQITIEQERQLFERLSTLNKLHVTSTLFWAFNIEWSSRQTCVQVSCVDHEVSVDGEHW